MCVSQTGVGPVSHKAIKGRVSSGMCDGAGQRAGGAVACVFVCSVRVINKRKRRGTNNVLLLGPGLDPFSTFTRPPPLLVYINDPQRQEALGVSSFSKKRSL